MSSAKVADELAALSPRIYEEMKQNDLGEKYYKKAKIFIQSGKHDKAEYYYYMAAAFATDNEKYIQELATCLSIQKKFKKALEVYLILAAKYPKKNIYIWQLKNKLLTYYKLTQEEEIIDEAIQVFSRITLILENRVSSLDFLGDLYWIKNKQTKAIQNKVLAATEKSIRLKKIDILLPKPFTFTKEQLRLPDFLVIGPQKSGTTALYKYITDHPQIYPASNKEILFFDSKYSFGLDWYKSHFPIISSRTYLTGEASPTYLINSIKAAERILQILPEVKLIFIIRDPVDRAISDYYMKVRDGLEDRSLEEAIFSEINFLSEKKVDILNPRKEFKKNNKGYIRNSLYFYFLSVYYEKFKSKNCLLIEAQELKINPKQVMNSVFNFLGTGPHEGKYPVVNAGNYSKDINPSITSKLSHFFSPFNEKLEKLIKRSLSWK